MTNRVLRYLVSLTVASGFASACRYGYESMPLSGEAPVTSGGASAGAWAGGGAESWAGGAGGSAGAGGAPVLGNFGSAPYCDLLHRLPKAPDIDGILDEGPPLQDIAPQGFVSYNDLGPEYQTLPSNVSSRFAAAWVEDGLYFFIQVTDPNLAPAPEGDLEWRGDAYEIYVDHDASFAPPGEFDDPGTRQFIIAAPLSESADATRAGSYTTTERIEDFSGDWVSKPRPGGYIVEALIRAADLGLDSWSLSVGTSVAFDLSHNVSLPPGVASVQENLLGQYFLEVAEPFTGADEDLPYTNSGVFCTPELALP